jgi:hypothetical protein
MTSAQWEKIGDAVDSIGDMKDEQSYGSNV